jgi:hypothetical protein
VRWEKIKIQKRWLLGRLSDDSFVPSLYVYFCRSFLLCRLLGLQVTVCSYKKLAGFPENVSAEKYFPFTTNFSLEHNAANFL